jgi:hypothetical protein
MHGKFEPKLLAKYLPHSGNNVFNSVYLCLCSCFISLSEGYKKVPNSSIQMPRTYGQLQRPRKHLESGGRGALAQRGTFVYDQNQTILCRSRGRKCLKIWNLYNIGNGLYRVFTTAKRALSFQQKRAFIQEILFFVL